MTTLETHEALSQIDGLKHSYLAGEIDDQRTVLECLDELKRYRPEISAQANAAMSAVSTQRRAA
ncbi:MAG: hypothetical protein ACR2QF_09170 [Geminicoccaceae bacterium]